MLGNKSGQYRNSELAGGASSAVVPGAVEPQPMIANRCWMHGEQWRTPAEDILFPPGAFEW